VTAYWMLETRDEPLRTIHRFLREVFQHAELDRMLIPLRMGGPPGVEPHFIDEPEHLADADPFAPLMTVNAARMIVKHIKANPTKRIGAVLRPCEIRALHQVAQHEGIDLARLFLIGVDCLGTFPTEEFEWRFGIDRLTHKALQFARQGGINPHRLRSACQMCVEPVPEQVNVAVHVLGLPTQQVILISSPSPDGFILSEITGGAAPTDLIDRHERMPAALIERRKHARERIIQALDTNLAVNLDALVAHLESCDTCQACLAACPTYSTFHTKGQTLTRDSVAEWLLTCSGCGICEEVCAEHLPLTAIFTRIQEELVTVSD
jgi:formate dehydrogenase subunit beta